MQVERVKLPNLTRVDKRIGVSDPDFGFKRCFGGFHHDFLNTDYSRSSDRLVTDLFLGNYLEEDIAYRLGFLEEWTVNAEAKKQNERVRVSLPDHELRFVHEEDTESTIKKRIGSIRKHLLVPETLEKILNLESNSKAVSDLKVFAAEAKKMLNDNGFVKFVEPILQSPEFRDRSSIDIEWANNVRRQMTPYRGDLEQIVRVRGDLDYYRLLSAPYNFEGVSFCQPKLLDPELRQGRIVEAYYPEFFKFVSIRKEYKDVLKLDKLNVPNDFFWGDEKRYTFVGGPNSEGKTISLKSLAFNIQMVLNGSFPFCRLCELSLPSEIFYCPDMGDSLNAGHFESGATKIQKMKNKVQKNSFVFLDEAGGGTEPDEVRVVAKGISDSLMKAGITFYNVTHDRSSWEGHINDSGVNILTATRDKPEIKFKILPGIPEIGYAAVKAKQMGITKEDFEEEFTKRGLI